MRNLSRGLILFVLAGVFSATPVLSADKIDINSAPLEDLIKVIHIGETRAKELISLRPFSSLDELIKIKGIGSSRLEDIKNQDLAWVNEVNSQSTEPQQTETIEPPEEKNLAALSESAQFLQKETKTGRQTVVIAVVLAVLSGIIILFLKKKTKISYD